MQEDMIQGILTRNGRFHKNFQVFKDFFLAGKVIERSRSEFQLNFHFEIIIVA